MNTYLAAWYNNHGMNYIEIKAENTREAKAKAFRMMCDMAGDRIYEISIYELKTTVKCDGEPNPAPLSHTAAYAKRDYWTGNKK